MKFDWRKFGKNILKTIGLALFGGVCTAIGAGLGLIGGAWAEAEAEGHHDDPEASIDVLNTWCEVFAGGNADA